ncbi:MAG: AAA domain-containing protein [Phycisphaerales bacterium]
MSTSPDTPSPDGPTARAGSKVMLTMLERLFASIAGGPSLNCRPHNSRQRVDWFQLAKLGDTRPETALAALLGESMEARVHARVQPPRDFGDDSEPTEDQRAELDSAKRAWSDQSALLTKLRLLVEEARTYEDDTGVWVLNLGYPLLSLPPGMSGGRGFGTRRVLAPIAFVPVSLTVKTGASPSIEVACRSDEIDRVTPNEALLAWLEQQTGQKFGEVFTDEQGTSAWREIAELTRRVAELLKISAPAEFAGAAPLESVPLVAAPRAEGAGDQASIVAAAVIGLFPLANEGLLRDTQAMAEQVPQSGPIAAFIRGDTSLERVAAGASSAARHIVTDRLVTTADPCQARAVGLARTHAGLVVHGPPGTGKSQTITNIIGDHLARGERVLFVCEKRTALDVVANRLEGLGLGKLCAVVHDPQRDQKDLYMGIRAQLEELTESRTDPKAAPTVERLSKELGELHGELNALHHALMQAAPGETPFTAMVGEWLALGTGEGAGLECAGSLEQLSLHELEAHDVALTNLYHRATGCDYAANPWTPAHQGTSAAFVSKPMDRHRAAVAECTKAARDLDAWRDEKVPAFDTDAPLDAQVAARDRFLSLVPAAMLAPPELRSLWCSADAAWRENATKVLRSLDAQAAAMASAPQDPALSALASQLSLTLPSVTQRLAEVERWASVASKWWAFVALGKKKAATAALAPLGLSTAPSETAVGVAFYRSLKAAMIVRASLEAIERRGSAGATDPRREADQLRHHDALAAAFGACAEPMGAVDPAIALSGGPPAESLLAGLRDSAAAARRMGELERAADATALISPEWMKQRREVWRSGRSALAVFDALERKLGDLEDVLRTAEEARAMPTQLAEAALSLAATHAPHEGAAAALRRRVLAGEISRRIGRDAVLHGVDARRVQTVIARCSELEAKRQLAVREMIVHNWTERHRERLLAGTGSRLNSEGASVRQRLTTRGKNALRLRQVLALGRATEGGDPLLDLRPVWMVSPETVSQIFPREPLFDVVVFDEASQLRLEEALPVLTRARRVVVAGDPKQLPPTRFFESSVAQSDTEEIETEAQLFEAQQSQTEDLLSAALSLDIEQSYLDVHYRSRNGDLIEFSNDHFYGSRLQAIPGHPKNRVKQAPLTLVRVEGVYDKRTNAAEATKVAEIIRELLKRPNPPSIGVGCFNIAQRDLISETLDEFAEQDPGFASALAAARSLRSKGAHEGLFVKNLENVQGDERDHIIISTTYGPDAHGRFFRRFGPLAMPGGGRRLNVLVTRAREAVHLVTSIPRDQYLALPPVPSGQTPGGGWLLFAYLKFAEELQSQYAAAENLVGAAEEGHPEAEAALIPPTEVAERPTKTPSLLARGLAAQLASRRGMGSIVHWGNEGFCVDIALRDTASLADVTGGVLCDWSRFGGSENAVEWDMFRASVLESQGWKLKRVWSPVVFRDLSGVVDGL